MAADAPATAAKETTAAPTSAPTMPKREGGLFDPSTFIMIGIVFLASIFLLQRPEKKRQEERLKAMEGLKKGDRVLSASGIHGVVARVNKEKETVFVTVAKDVEIEFSKSVISPYEEPKVEPKAPQAASDPKRLEDTKSKKVKA